MGFQRIAPLYIKGANLFGIDLDSLHSDEIDRQGLKDWADTFSRLIPDTIGQTSYGEDIPFYDAFKRDLAFFCIYVANSDGNVSDDEIEAINWLIDYKVAISEASVVCVTRG